MVLNLHRKINELKDGHYQTSTLSKQLKPICHESQIYILGTNYLGRKILEKMKEVFSSKSRETSIGHDVVIFTVHKKSFLMQINIPSIITNIHIEAQVEAIKEDKIIFKYNLERNV